MHNTASSSEAAKSHSVPPIIYVPLIRWYRNRHWKEGEAPIIKNEITPQALSKNLCYLKKTDPFYRRIIFLATGKDFLTVLQRPPAPAPISGKPPAEANQSAFKRYIDADSADYSERGWLLSKVKEYVPRPYPDPNPSAAREFKIDTLTQERIKGLAHCLFEARKAGFEIELATPENFKEKTEAVLKKGSNFILVAENYSAAKTPETETQTISIARTFLEEKKRDKKNPILFEIFSPEHLENDPNALQKFVFTTTYGIEKPLPDPKFPEENLLLHEEVPPIDAIPALDINPAESWLDALAVSGNSGCPKHNSTQRNAFGRDMKRSAPVSASKSSSLDRPLKRAQLNLL